MSTNKPQHPTHQDPEVVIENALNRTELFFEKNGKKLLIALCVVVLVIAGFLGYNQFIRQPYINDAATAMSYAQRQFENDSLSVALKGNGKELGFEQIITEYSGTPQANLAKQYAGICYLNLGEYQKAVDSFTSFSAVSGTLGTLVNAQNLGLTGDAYSELGNLDKAFEYYQKAASYSDNIDTTPTYIFRSAVVCLAKGDNAKAGQLFQSIQDNYPQSIYSRDIEKYIALAAQK